MHYRSIHHLLSLDMDDDLRAAYCSVVIKHRAVTRNKVTKEILDTKRPQTLEGTKDTFLNAQRQWEESEPCKRLISALQNIPTSVKVERIVALSCGSVARDRSSVQHALALTISKALTAKQSETESVPCYAQDPCYSSVDESLLAEFGIDVLDDPDGFLAVDDSSIVLSIASDAPVKQIIVDLAKPAAIIWDKVDLDDTSDSLQAFPQLYGNSANNY